MSYVRQWDYSFSSKERKLWIEHFFNLNQKGTFFWIRLLPWCILFISFCQLMILWIEPVESLVRNSQEKRTKLNSQMKANSTFLLFDPNRWKGNPESLVWQSETFLPYTFPGTSTHWRNSQSEIAERLNAAPFPFSDPESFFPPSARRLTNLKGSSWS